jgi:hypothetical protein
VQYVKGEPGRWRRVKREVSNPDDAHVTTHARPAPPAISAASFSSGTALTHGAGFDEYTPGECSSCPCNGRLQRMLQRRRALRYCTPSCSARFGQPR